MSKPPIFSEQLEHWIKGSQPKTLATLIELFGEKSFAVLILLFMAIPALPVPTGGITHVLEIVVALLALEQIAGLRGIWLPPFLTRRIQLKKILGGKLGVSLIKRIKQLEKHSSPRWKSLFGLPLVSRLIGLLVLGLTAGAFFAPPFSGLDTLPSLGVVLITLAIILDDAVMFVAGTVVGIAGIALSVFLGAEIVKLFHHLF